MAETIHPKKGLRVRARQREYPATETQINLIKSAEYCGIRKGISRAELMDKMKNCIPEYYKKLREGQLNGEKTD